MIRLRRGTVLAVRTERRGALEVEVETEGDVSIAVVYPALVGPVVPGDRVLLNTTAAHLSLGTGGVHIVVAVEGERELDPDPLGHLIKLRYTPHQVKVLSAEEDESPHRAVMAAAQSLGGAPVVWVPLHSMLAPAVVAARSAGASRVSYVMTDGAALPAPLSRLAAHLRDAGLLDAVVSTGQAFGGDVEAVNVFSGLLVARHVLHADVIVVGDGPGNAGTGTTWGASDVASAMAMNAAAVLDGRPLAALRVSFADPRQRHRGVSHHTLTALGRVAAFPVHVAVPVIEDEVRRRVVWDALRSASLHEKHHLVEATGRPGVDELARLGIKVESMGRSVEDDPEFFLAAGAAGVLAGRMAVRDRQWRTE